jgi:hypothetical protein
MSQNSAKLLLSANALITCPNCQQEFAVADGFAKRALEQVEGASSNALAKLREEERVSADRQAQILAKERDAVHSKALAEVRTLTAQTFAPQIDALKEQLAASNAKIVDLDQREGALLSRERAIESRVAEAAAARAAELVAGERLSYEKRFADQNARLQVLQAEQLTLREERQKLQDEKAAMAFDVQRQVAAKSAEREEFVRAQERERAQLDKAELQKKLDDAGEQLAAAQRKMEQGSQQLQGEVLELAIEESIRRAFPLDTIEEVKKGQRGGDLLQHVVTRSGHPAGTILWETKRAKDWSLQWIPKLKEDMRASGAVVGILVTTPGAVPKDWPASASFALHEDIWVTHPSCAVSVAELLRVGLLDLHRQRAVSAGKGEKMEAVYDYVTSPQFAHKLKAVFETFKKMKEELDSEMNVTQQRWARRLKQLDAGKMQLLGIGGEIQGLAQNELPMLDLESTSLEQLDP